MAITSSSTLAQVVAEYEDNADYGNPASTTKARLFEKACMVLLVRLPRRAGKGGENIELDVRLVSDELKRVRAWLASRNSGSVLHYDISEVRNR